MNGRKSSLEIGWVFTTALSARSPPFTQAKSIACAAQNLGASPESAKMG
jgi:hypothetical protein